VQEGGQQLGVLVGFGFRDGQRSGIRGGGFVVAAGELAGDA